jgi:hypothetical protein
LCCSEDSIPTPAPKPYPVKTQLQFSGSDNKGALAVVVILDIAPGYFLLANPTENAELDSAKTLITATNLEDVNALKVNYPMGKRVSCKILGHYMVYSERVTIQVTVGKAKNALQRQLSIHVFPQTDGGNACVNPRLFRYLLP